MTGIGYWDFVRLLPKVEACQGFVMTKHGTAVAKLVPVQKKASAPAAIAIFTRIWRAQCARHRIWYDQLRCDVRSRHSLALSPSCRLWRPDLEFWLYAWLRRRRKMLLRCSCPAP